MKAVILVQITYSSDHPRLAYLKGVAVKIKVMFLLKVF